jgi:hypothetical protein
MKKWQRNFDNGPSRVTEAFHKTHVKDLESKNKVLHKCAYTAHSAITKLLNEIDSMEIPQIALTLGDLKTELEGILMKGTEEIQVVVPEPKIEIAT